jgi:hypothetical protein
LTGERTLPTVPNLKDFTGEGLDPVAQGEMAARQKLQARMGQEEPELSPEEFERRMIDNPQPEPERYEQDGKTTDEYRKMLPQAPEESVDMGDVDSPEFKAAAAQEGTNGDVIDLDKESPAPLQIGETQAQPPRLSTQLLPSRPTVVSKAGKQLYESTGPSGRWGPMVAGVFEPFLNHDNPEIGAAAKRAQAMSAKLIEVDGVAPKDAIKIGMDYLNGEANRAINLERTKIGSKPRFGGGGTSGGSGILGPKDDRAESIDKYGDNIRTALQNAGITASEQKLAAAESAILSDDPALQKDAIKALLQARSGLTVSEGERRSYLGVDGLLPQAENMLLGWAGKPMTETSRRSILSIIRNMRQANAKTIESIKAEEKRRYEAQNKRKVAPEVLRERSDALYTPPSGGETEEDLY